MSNTTQDTRVERDSMGECRSLIMHTMERVRSVLY